MKKAGICGICPGGCGVEVTLEDGKLTQVEPHTGIPFGNLCLRGKFAPEIVYSPDRIQTPLIRTGERGEGNFRRASWDEALQYAADKILEIRKEHGPKALMAHTGRGTFEKSMHDFGGTGDSSASRLLLSLGCVNTGSVGSVCYVSYGKIAPITTLGVDGRQIGPDLEESETLVVWGANPATDSPPFFHGRMQKAKNRGVKLIVIDHMKSDAAKQADLWVPVRSGTDGALVLGIIRIMVEEGWYDKEFAREWTIGFEDLVAYCQSFSLETVEQVTGVPPAVQRQLAWELSRPRVSLKTYTGLEYSNCGVQSIRAVHILWALAGNLDSPGGLYIDGPAREWAEVWPLPDRGDEKPLGADKYPVFYEMTQCAQFMEFPRAVLEKKPYPVKGLINQGSSILTSYPQPGLWEEAFRQLELLVVIDRFMTRDALFADVVLPATTYYENRSYHYYPGGYVRLREPMIEPVGEARNDVLIVAGLAEKLGCGEGYPKTEEEIIQKAFGKNPELLKELKNSPHGVRLPERKKSYQKYKTGTLRQDGQKGFPTPSGKLEIRSSLLEKYGYDGLPKYVEPVEGPMGDSAEYEKYPLVMNTGARIHSTFRSQHLNIAGLLKVQPKPQVLIHPQDAATRNIADGEAVEVHSKRGKATFYACVTDRVMPGGVEINMGGGSPIQALAWREANANVLTDMENRDPISGFPTYKTLLCQVEKAAGGKEECNRIG